MEDTIDAIEAIRRDTNSLWMSVLRIAVTHGPEDEVAKLLDGIEYNDGKVRELFRELRENL